MGKICINTLNSRPLVAAISGLIIGMTVCLFIIILLRFLLRGHKRRKNYFENLKNQQLTTDIFLLQLNDIKPNANFFFKN